MGSGSVGEALVVELSYARNHFAIELMVYRGKSSEKRWGILIKDFSSAFLE